MNLNHRNLVKLAALSAFGVASWLGGRLTERQNVVHNQKVLVLNKEDLFDTLEKYAIPTPKSVRSDYSESKAQRINEIMKYGYPSLDNVRLFHDFVLAYDNRNRIPYWTCEHLTKERVKRVGEVTREHSEFKEDIGIDEYFRAHNADYHRSGYDRGHLAAAGNHMLKQEYCDETFTLSNIAPQVGVGFNRHSWNRLEKYVRKLARERDNVYVYTGPLFLEEADASTKRKYVRYEVIGQNNVAVPTHFFKVILAENKDLTFMLNCFVMPNKPIDDKQPLSDFYTSLDNIERRSGLSFKGIHKQQDNRCIRDINVPKRL